MEKRENEMYMTLFNRFSSKFHQMFGKNNGLSKNAGMTLAAELYQGKSTGNVPHLCFLVKYA